MLLKKIIFFNIVIYFLFLLPGCWDSLDVNNRALLTLVLVDYKDEQYIFYVEVPNLKMSQGEGGGGDGYELYSIVRAEGESFAETREFLDLKMEQPIFEGTIKTLIVTQNLANHNFEEYVHRVQADAEYRKTLSIVTTSEEPELLLNIKPAKNISIGSAVEQLTHVIDQNGKKLKINVSDVLEYLASETCFVLPDIGLHNEQLICKGYTVFHDGLRAGFITSKESKGFLWISGRNVVWNYFVEMDGYDATIEIKLKKRTITPYYNNKKPMFDLDFEFDTRIMYLSKRISLDKAKEEEIRKKIEEMLIRDINEAIEQSQVTKCDYLGFRDKFRIKYPTEIRGLDWCKEYSKSEFNISVKSKIRPGGLADFKAIPKAKQ